MGNNGDDSYNRPQYSVLQAAQFAKELDARRRALVKQKKTSKIGFDNVTLPTSEQD